MPRVKVPVSYAKMSTVQVVGLTHPRQQERQGLRSRDDPSPWAGQKDGVAVFRTFASVLVQRWATLSTWPGGSAAVGRQPCLKPEAGKDL